MKRQARCLADLHTDIGSELSVLSVRYARLVPPMAATPTDRVWFSLPPPGVDDAESECDLDGVTGWDLSVTNNGDPQPLEEAVTAVTDWCSA